MKINKNSNGYSNAKKGQTNIAGPKQRIRLSPLAKKVLIKGENARDFEDLRQKVLSEGVPQTEIEFILCEKIISTLWKIRRAGEIEQTLLNKENEITFEEQHRDRWDPPGRKRITNIKLVSMNTSEVQYVIQQQAELEKMLQKLFTRLRTEQKLRTKAKEGEK